MIALSLTIEAIRWTSAAKKRIDYGRVQSVLKRSSKTDTALILGNAKSLKFSENKLTLQI
jgi:hypothetical protein